MLFKFLFAKKKKIPPSNTTILFGYSAILWFVIGTGMGSYNAAKLAFPDFVTGVEMFSFGHMRQVHVMAVIFGWISMAFAMTMMYLTPALGNTRLWSEKLGLWTALNWNVGLSLGLILLWIGITSGRENSDLIWPIDLVFIAAALIPLCFNVWMTSAHRRSQGIYITNWNNGACTFMVTVT